MRNSPDNNPFLRSWARDHGVMSYWKPAISWARSPTTRNRAIILIDAGDVDEEMQRKAIGRDQHLSRISKPERLEYDRDLFYAISIHANWCLKYRYRGLLLTHVLLPCCCVSSLGPLLPLYHHSGVQGVQYGSHLKITPLHSQGAIIWYSWFLTRAYQLMPGHDKKRCIAATTTKNHGSS